MKKVLFSLVILLSGWFSKSYGQLDTLFTWYVSDLDSASGYCYFNSNRLAPGELFELYQSYFEDTVNNLVLQTEWEDPWFHLHHYYYQQTYKGLPVEDAVYKEHADSNDQFVFLAHGMLAPGMEGNPNPVASESEALGQIFTTYIDNTFAWMVDSVEMELQADLGDSTATYYPDGELLWAIDNFADVTYLLPAERYRLAWRFEVYSLEPAFDKAIFVDATTGEIFREEDLYSYNGPGSTWYHGTRTIDTKQVGNKWRLIANDNSRNIHTKKGTFPDQWGLCPNYIDAGDDWDVADIHGTSTHWFASESWDFFQGAPYNYDVNAALGGANDNPLRVMVEVLDNDGLGSRYRFKNGHHLLLFTSNDESHALDIVGHEFTHAIQESFPPDGLNTEAEAGTLREGFGDIFGELIEERTDGTMDWIHGADPGNIDTRDFDDPNSDYYNHEDGQGCQVTNPGQPDTYGGNLWYTEACDYYGIHGNCGVINHWFYLLSEGGTGFNDFFANYDVQGLGTATAGRIAFISQAFFLTNADGFQQARAATIAAAQIITQTQCSNEEIQTAAAWYAVGVGLPSLCPPVASADPYQVAPETVRVSPNPSSGNFVIDFDGTFDRSLEVRTLLGAKIMSLEYKSTHQIVLDLENYPNGIYLVHIRDKKGSSVLKLVKQ